jgi:hypothetical protein
MIMPLPKPTPISMTKTRIRLQALLVLAVAFFLGGLTERFLIYHLHPLKHTWDCVFIAQASRGAFWFERPNGEIFEMYFDNPPILRVGMAVQDIAYRDDNADMRHFVYARMKQQ